MTLCRIFFPVRDVLHRSNKGQNFIPANHLRLSQLFHRRILLLSPALAPTVTKSTVFYSRWLTDSPISIFKSDRSRLGSNRFFSHRQTTIPIVSSFCLAFYAVLKLVNCYRFTATISVCSCSRKRKTRKPNNWQRKGTRVTRGIALRNPMVGSGIVPRYL